MKNMKTTFAKAFILFLVLAVFGFADPIKSDEKPISLAQLQLNFLNTRYQAYFHYNLCTFKNLNATEHFGRGDGTEPATLWAPTGLDCKQWAQVCKDARMEGGWLTTKHHDGFCLWDSKFTDYDVVSSNVRTDVVKEFVDAFRAGGLKIGLYYSILDYHHKIDNGITTREGIEFLKNQIRELLTNYGQIDYINFDGWSTWPTTPTFDDVPYGEIYALVKSIQPACLIISHTYESNLAHAEVPFADAAGRDYPYHPDYLRPTAASDFLQIDWWWDDNNNMRVRKSVDYILKKLDNYNSHNSVYILNISPNPQGRIDEDAIQRLKEVAAVWEKPADVEKPGANWGFAYAVSENLAFLKPCTQSSLHPFIRDKRAYPRAEIAVDGVTEGNWMMEQTSSTLKEQNPWWQVDLQATKKINEITIFNATDSSKVCLKDFTVSILDADKNQVWSSHQTSSANPSVSLPVDGKKGRYVKVQLNGTDHLRLAEVIVKGR
jgi:alpha-L-fucosidase